MNSKEISDLQRRAERLIKDALAVRGDCDSLIDSCLEEPNIEGWADELEKTKLYSAVCGDQKSGPKDLRIFWNCVRAVNLDQLGGFLVDQNTPAHDIVRLTDSKGPIWTLEPPKDPEGDRPEGSKGEPSLAPLRRYAAVSLYRSIRNFIPRPKTEEQPDHDALRLQLSKDPEEYLQEARQRLAKGIPEIDLKKQKSEQDKESRTEQKAKQETSKPRIRFREGQLPQRLGILHRHELIALLRSAGIKLKTTAKAQDSDNLFAHLAILMTRGNDRANAIEIALLLRILAGRNLNHSPSTEPNWKQTFEVAIRYVLEKQMRPEGHWPRIDNPMFRDSPFHHEYTPLIYLLDLGTDLLAPHFERLVDACELVRDQIRHDLEDHRLDFQSEKNQSSKRERLARELTIWLSVSTIMADRMKDLLSSTILAELGAIVPETDIGWKDISDALGFKENLEEGVIKKWHQRSRSRPGAILIYGPPGTGKTTIAKVLATELNTGRRWKKYLDTRWRFLGLDPADFARDGMDKIVANAERLFHQLRQVRRCVVLLDEMEEFLRIRDEHSSKESRLITTAFLPLLQEVVQSREIILVVATNFVGNIDPAVTRRGRFDLILPLGPPDDDSRQHLLQKFDGIENLLSEDGRLIDEEELCDLRKLLSYFMMGYTLPEMKDFYQVFKKKWSATDPSNLVETLWQIRCAHVPTALSGRVGSSWRTFADEAQRYTRYAVQTTADEGYWREPHLPPEKDRVPGLTVAQIVDSVLRRSKKK